jgi:membrane protein YdbS with pleckstrin-like domain
MQEERDFLRHVLKGPVEPWLVWLAVVIVLVTSVVLLLLDTFAKRWVTPVFLAAILICLAVLLVCTLRVGHMRRKFEREHPDYLFPR